jgi:hypothetical protein
VPAHIAVGTGVGAAIVAAIIAITRVITNIIRLTAFALQDDKRWPRFRNSALFVIFLLLAIAIVAGWWLFGDSGLQVILHDFGPASITHHAAAS